jgi:YVTN family beta-propeller protein
MSDHPRTERLVAEWLDDMRHPRPPDYVVQAVLNSLPSTRQDSSAPWRVAVRRYGRAGLAAAAAIAIGALALAVLVRPEAPAQPGASPSPTPTSSGQAGVPLPPGVSAIDMGNETWSLTVDDASVWVQDQDNVIRRIDQATNSVGGLVPREVPHMQLEDGQLWALSGGTEIIRVDPLTGRILQEFTGVSGFNIAVDHTTAWVSDAGHTVERIDLETGEVVASIDVPAGPRELIVFEGDVWVACDEGGAVARIDADTNTVIATIDVGWRPVNLAGGEGAVWVRSFDTRLLRIDPITNTVAASDAATIEGVERAPATGIAVGDGSVWVAVSNGIGRVDPATIEIVEVIPIGKGGYFDLVWFDDELWASSTDRKLVFRMEIKP